jgi:hypothetical protein
MLVPLSPKFQDHAVGLPVEESVNVTICPITGVAGVNVKPAVTVPGRLTVTVRFAVLAPAAFPAVSETVNDPAVENAWVGFWSALVAPSPKVQLHEVGLPDEESVNCTVKPVVIVPDVKENPATGATALDVEGDEGVVDVVLPHPATRAHIRTIKIRRHIFLHMMTSHSKLSGTCPFAPPASGNASVR